MSAPRSWRLSGRNGWGAELPTGDADQGRSVSVTPAGVVAGADRLTLASGAGGPRDPAASPASAGGLALPPNMDTREGSLLLASGRMRRLRRYDDATATFRDWYVLPPPAHPLLLAAVRAVLVLAPAGGRRLRALHPHSGMITAEAALPVGYRLLDVEAVGERRVAALVASAGSPDPALWFWEPGRAATALRRLPGVPEPGLSARRLVRDRDGRLAVVAFGAPASAGVAGAACVLFVDADADAPAGWLALDEVRGRFEERRIAVEADVTHGWRFRVAPAEAGAVPWPAPAGWPVFSPDGERLEVPPDSWAGPPPFVTRGTLTIGPLDAGRRRNTWDRVELELGRFPGGAAVRVQTRSAEDPDADELEAPWSEPHRSTGTERPDAPVHADDFALLSPPGRYLWLRLGMVGGATTPELHSVTLRYPRAGLVDYLPAVFREADEESRFLERLVGALEATWAPLERAVDDVARDVVPETVQTPGMLEYLAAWLDQPLDQRWDVPARRRTVRHAAGSLFHRGTPAAFQGALRQHLANLQGRSADALGSVPFVWEHFRSRPVQQLGADAELTLFGSEVLQRLRLGQAPLGEGVLRELGSPETDPVTLHAHRFSVFVPRTLLPTEADLADFHRVVERERPAHAEGEVVLVEARLRIGAQASLGVDTVIGVYPEARLAATTEETWDTPAARLDYDCLLAGDEPDARPGPELGTRDGALPWRIR
jgi:phage tail-like protein